MIDVYYWPTPNGHKITIFLEEAELPYKLIPVNITKGDQFTPDFLKISPNNKMPAIVDHAPLDGKESISVFESGAILLYLSDKIKRFIASDLRGRTTVWEWLFWQVGGLGPMLGQNHHFVQYAPERIPYAMDRYLRETARLYGVLNKQLQNKAFIADEYSIVDMACYPWIVPHKNQLQDLEDFPNLKRWFESMQAREAVQRAYAIPKKSHFDHKMTDEAKKILFGNINKEEK